MPGDASEIPREGRKIGRNSLIVRHIYLCQISEDLLKGPFVYKEPPILGSVDHLNPQGLHSAPPSWGNRASVPAPPRACSTAAPRFPPSSHTGDHRTPCRAEGWSTGTGTGMPRRSDCPVLRQGWPGRLFVREKLPHPAGWREVLCWSPAEVPGSLPWGRPCRWPRRCRHRARSGRSPLGS